MPSSLPRDRRDRRIRECRVQLSRRAKVFTDFNLRIEAGQRVGLVGQSGGGKSTLFALLQRFYDVQGERILVGGHNIARVTQESLRAAIAIVPQDTSLFHRSIMENIRYGRPEASDAEVHEAVVAAHCADFIENLPKGMATIVGDRGVKLSPGQRQRIGMARAFLKDAPILFGPRSHLGARQRLSEELSGRRSNRLMRGRTVIAIAHRLATCAASIASSCWMRERSARTARPRPCCNAMVYTPIWCGEKWHG